MDPNEAKPPQEPKDVPRTMKELMERMCCSGELGPADMCRRMMHVMGRPSNAEAKAAPENGTASDEPGSRDDEAPRGCCGPRSSRAPKRP